MTTLAGEGITARHELQSLSQSFELGQLNRTLDCKRSRMNGDLADVADSIYSTGEQPSTVITNDQQREERLPEIGR